jgi:large subunit ribosomal protein L10
VALNLDSKKAIVAEVTEVAKHATSLVAANYSGLTVAQLTELRKTARESGVYMRVVRNTLAKRAFQGTSFSCMDPALVGPLVLAFSTEDPGAAARVMRDFSKKFEKLEVKALSVDGALLAASELNSLANLPTRDQAIAQLMSVMLAPITQLARTLAEPHTMLVRAIAAVAREKEIIV